MIKSDRIHINASQIRAARALLNWSQEELAQATGLSVATIRKIESGHISPRGKTTDSVVDAFEQARIEFMPSGVRLRDNDVIILEGDDCYLQLLDDILNSTKRKGSEVLFLYADGRLSQPHETESELRIRKQGVKWRLICEEGNTQLIYPLQEWRWLPKAFFKRNIQVIYGSKVALGFHVDGSRNLTTKIIIIDSVPLADSTRNLCEFLWSHCPRPTHSTAVKTYE